MTQRRWRGSPLARTQLPRIRSSDSSGHTHTHTHHGLINTTGVRARRPRHEASRSERHSELDQRAVDFARLRPRLSLSLVLVREEPRSCREERKRDAAVRAAIRVRIGAASDIVDDGGSTIILQGEPASPRGKRDGRRLRSIPTVRRACEFTPLLAHLVPGRYAATAAAACDATTGERNSRRRRGNARDVVDVARCARARLVVILNEKSRVSPRRRHETSGRGPAEQGARSARDLPVGFARKTRARPSRRTREGNAASSRTVHVRRYGGRVLCPCGKGGFSRVRSEREVEHTTGPFSRVKLSRCVFEASRVR